MDLTKREAFRLISSYLTPRGFSRPELGYLLYEDAPAETALLAAWPDKRSAITDNPAATAEAENLGWTVIELNEEFARKYKDVAFTVSAVQGNFRGDLPFKVTTPSSQAAVKQMFKFLNSLRVATPERSVIDDEETLVFKTKAGPVALWLTSPKTGKAPQLKQHHAAGYYIIAIPAGVINAVNEFEEMMRDFLLHGTVTATKAGMKTSTSRDEDVFIHELFEYMCVHHPDYAHKWGQPARDYKYKDPEYGVKTTPDFFWEEQKVAVFVDGLYHHGGRSVQDQVIKLFEPEEKKEAAKKTAGIYVDILDKDLIKTSSMTSAGFTVLRYSDKVLKTAEGLAMACRKVCECLERAENNLVVDTPLAEVVELPVTETEETPEQDLDEEDSIGDLFAAHGL